jgi:hypothetical protein
VILSAPTSFSGSAKRIWRITEGEHGGAAKAGLVTAAILLIALAWSLVAIWYCLCLLFFVPFIIFRLFRRGARKDKAAQLRHRETLAQMEASRNQSSTPTEQQQPSGPSGG